MEIYMYRNVKNESKMNLKNVFKKKSVERNCVDEDKKILDCMDIMEILKIKKSKSYEIIKKLNEELSEKGFITISGKVPKNYFEERMCLS